MSHSPALSPVLRPERRVLRDEVYDAVLGMLVDGHFRAGESLGIEPLAARLGVSPTPVREALVQLESTGLVTRTALRGYKVAPPMSREQIRQLFDARLVVEVGAGRHAVAGREELVPQLRVILDRQRRHAATLRRAGEGDQSVRAVSDYLTADRDFHDAVFAATGNPFFIEMARHISIHGQRLRQFIEQQHDDAELAVAEHERILTAIDRGEPDGVAQAVESHILAVRERTLSDAPEGEPIP